MANISLRVTKEKNENTPSILKAYRFSAKKHEKTGVRCNNLFFKELSFKDVKSWAIS